MWRGELETEIQHCCDGREGETQGQRTVLDLKGIGKRHEGESAEKENRPLWEQFLRNWEEEKGTQPN